MGSIGSYAVATVCDCTCAYMHAFSPTTHATQNLQTSSSATVLVTANGRLTTAMALAWAGNTHRCGCDCASLLSQACRLAWARTSTASVERPLHRLLHQRVLKSQVLVRSACAEGQLFLARLAGPAQVSRCLHRTPAFRGMPPVGRRAQRYCITSRRNCITGQHSGTCKEFSRKEPEQLEMWGL